jgi:hypothetical protein
MPSYRSATVTEILEERPGLQRVLVGEERAYVLSEQVGPVSVGDEVVFNTTAVDLGLGTGGWHVVHWNLSRREWSGGGGGHIMKVRYTSLQSDTGASEEDADPGSDLGGIPVVVCTLHSQVAIVATTFLHLRPDARVVYVMTDGAALPLALSDLVVAMRAVGVIHATVTAGHAFGGDREAVSVPSALAIAARLERADLVIAGMGPGVVGTDSALGTTAVEAASILDATVALGGRPILCVRASQADARPLHRGASHHVGTVLGLTRSRVEVAVVPGAELDDERHDVRLLDPPDVPALLAGRGLEVRSMGRGPEQDPLFYAAAGAAGVLAAGPHPRR